MKASVCNSQLARVRNGVGTAKQNLFLALTGMGVMTSARADLPALEEPSRGGSGILELWQNYGYDILLLLGLLVCAVCFLGVAYHSYNVYGEVQSRKATWGQLGATVGVGAGLLVLVIWLITKATEIL